MLGPFISDGMICNRMVLPSVVCFARTSTANEDKITHFVSYVVGSMCFHCQWNRSAVAKTCEGSGCYRVTAISFKRTHCQER